MCVLYSNPLLGSVLNGLTVPTLPGITCLSLNFVGTSTAWSVLRACQQTIKHLEIDRTQMNSQPLDSDDISTFYIPNLISLKMIGDSLNFMLYNSMNLVALTLETEVPLDMEFPSFPKLKELNIRGTDLLPILTEIGRASVGKECQY